MIQEVIVVEGKRDVEAVKRAIEADCILTGGFRLSPATMRELEHAYSKRGLIILTDPDSAGERIRKVLAQRFPNAKHAFIPKSDASTEDDIGVELASPGAILAALGKTRYQVVESRTEFGWADIFSGRLSGFPDAAFRRAVIGEKLGIGYANAKTFLRRLNNYGVTRQEFESALAELQDKGEHDET